MAVKTVNELLQDAAVDHAVNLHSYSNHVLRRMIATLNRTDASLAAALSAALERLPADSFTVQRLEALLSSVRHLNVQVYEQVGRELTVELAKFAAQEAAYQSELFERVIPQPVQAVFRIGRVNIDQVAAAVTSQPFQGRLLSQWTSKIEADRMTYIRNAVTTGYLEGQSTLDIVRQIRGTRALKYADGVLQRSRKDTATLVRSAINHVAAVARGKLVEANADIVSVCIWSSTLDVRTSEICRLRDRLRYAPVTHKPIGHKVSWLQGPGRSHLNCRSSEVVAVKSFRELGLDIDEVPTSTRASMDGQLPADTTYAQWLAKQPAGRQDEVLGVTRGRLMRQGGMKLPDFYTDSGVALSLAELAKRDAAAFARAGVSP